MARSSSSTRSGSDQYSESQSWGGSDSYTESGSSSDTYSSSHSEGGSSSHTTGGSTSSSRGGSSSQSTGESKSSSVGGSSGTSSSIGGNTSTGYGKSWASGQVSDRTQQKFNQATQDYVRSQKVEDAYAALQNAIDQKPTFQSQYEDKLTDMYNRIMNREAFTYDFNKDEMYKMYKDMYQRQGKTAMQDTMGQLAAMNSGYGSSYAQTAGQQTYQNYLQQLNDRIPELRQQALNEYDREGDRLAQQYSLTNDAYNREYGQYRDTMSDWQNERSFNQSAYQDERNFDYNQAQNDRSFWQNEYWQERNSEQSNMNQSQGTNWNEGTQNSTNWSNAYSQNRQNTESQNWQNSESRNWSDTESRNWSDTTSQSHTDTSGWSNTHSDNWSNSTSQSHQTGWSNTNSYSPDSGSGSSSRSSSSGGTVPYGNSASLEVYSQAKRESDIDQIAGYLHTNNQTELRNTVKDMIDKGVTIGSGKNKTTMTYTFQDVANMINEAMALNNRDPRNGSTYRESYVSARDVENLYGGKTYNKSTGLYWN